MAPFHEIAAHCDTYIHYHSDEYGPTATSIEDMAACVFALETGWTLAQLTVFIEDWFTC